MVLRTFFQALLWTVFWWIQNFAVTTGGTLSGLLLTWFASWFGGLDQMGITGYRVTNIMFALVTGVCMGIAGFLFEEKHKGNEIDDIESKRESETGKKKVPVLKMLAQLVKNKYCLNDMSKMAVLISLTTVPMLVGNLIVIPFIKRIDARTLTIFGTAGTAVFALLMWIFGVKSFTLLCVFFVIKMTFNGLSFAGQSVVSKITNAMATVVVGAILTVTDYVGGGVISEGLVRLLLPFQVFFI